MTIEIHTVSSNGRMTISRRGRNFGLEQTMTPWDTAYAGVKSKSWKCTKLMQILSLRFYHCKNFPADLKGEKIMV